MSAHEAEHEQPAVLLCGGLHCERLLGAHRHGLLAKDVAARVERSYGAFGVGAVPCADAHGVQLVLGEHIIAVVVAILNAVSLGVALCLLKIDVAAGDDLDLVAQSLVAVHVGVAYAAVADDSDFQCHFQNSLLFDVLYCACIH